MPLLRSETSNPNTEVFSADAQVLPSTANSKDGTIDVVWYSGAFVPRVDRSTGEPYMLKLDMPGCRFDRLNNGAPGSSTPTSPATISSRSSRGKSERGPKWA